MMNGSGVTNAQKQIGYEKREPTDLERMAIIGWEIDDINEQIAGLYNLRKQKEKEKEEIKKLVIEKARRGQFPFCRKEE